jgi:hypothetical protein
MVPPGVEGSPNMSLQFTLDSHETTVLLIFSISFLALTLPSLRSFAKPAEGRRRVPADQSKTSPCQIIDRLKTTDDQVERVPASGR